MHVVPKKAVNYYETSKITRHSIGNYFDKGPAVIASWLILSAWHGNWSVEKHYLVQGDHRFELPTVDPHQSLFYLYEQCKAFLNNELTVKDRFSLAWVLCADSQALQSMNLFSTTKLHLQVKHFSLDLFFDEHLLSKNLALQLFDALHLLLASFEEGCLTEPIHQVVEYSLAALSPSQLSGNLYGIHEQDILTTLQKHAKQVPHKLAIKDSKQAITYALLYQHVVHLAIQLKEKGVYPGQCIALEIPRSIDFIVSALAILYLNAVYIPIDPELPADRKKYMLNTSKARWLMGLNQSIQSISEPSPMDEELDFSTKDGGYALFTSGTTGLPKAAFISKKALNYYAAVAKTHYQLNPHDKVLQFAPVSFDASVEEIFPCLLAQATLIIRDASLDLSPEKFLQFIDEEGISFLDLPTGYWRELIIACDAFKVSLPACVRLIVIGGEALYESDLRLWFALPGLKPTLINSYGPTETTVVTTTQTIFANEEYPFQNRVLIGKPIAGAKIVLLDSFNNPCPLGGIGEICISSPGVAEGYLYSKKLTEEKFFIRKENDHHHYRYYRSGDLGRITADGQLEYLGRIDNVIKRHGFRISLGEIETHIRALSAVSDCSVFTLNLNQQDRLISTIQLKEKQSLSALDIHHYLAAQLPHYMLPNSFLFIEKLPRTLSGKVNYEWLRRWARNNLNEENHDLPKNEVLKKIQSVLGGTINLKANLVENGADSLDMVRLSILLEKMRGEQWSLSKLYSYASIENLLDALIDKNPEVSLFTTWRNQELALLKSQLLNTSEKTETSGSHYLVSGATGLLGRYIVRELITKTSKKIFCLVRSISKAKRLLETQLQLSTDDFKRITFIPCDLEKNRLGLDKDILSLLGDEVCDIIHCAANTNMLSPYSTLFKVNVNSSLHLLNLAIKAQINFHYISSLALLDDDGLKDISPQIKMDGIQELHSGYLQTKWMVERLLETLSTFTHKLAVYRCGRLWGKESNLGEANQDFIYQFLSVCLKTEAFPDIPMQLEASPADKIAKEITDCILDLPIQKENQERAVYHFCSNRSYNQEEIFRAMKKKNDKLKLLPSTQWLDHLENYLDTASEDKQLMKIYAVMKSSSMARFIDNMKLNMAGCPTDPLITADKMIETVIEAL